MKVFIVLALALVARAEPPIPKDYSYDMSPPSVNAPSASYGTPNQQYPGTPIHTGLTDATFTGFGDSDNHQHDMHSSQHSMPADRYLPASRNPSQQYSAPSNRQPSQQYGAPSSRQPSQQYGTPARTPSQQYGTPSTRQPSQQYGAPSNRASQQYAAPSIRTPANRQAAARQPSQQYGAPSMPAQEYGAPAFNGYPDSRDNSYDDDMSEPASYEYKYEVNDGDSGSEFGHKEERDGDSTFGEYRVLLPDGRTQVVTYEADENGYRPTITYLEPENQGYPKSGGGPY